MNGERSKTVKFSPLERALLNEAQREFPVCSRPYAELGKRVGCSEQEAYDAIQRLREQGVIRRIGGLFDSSALGYVGELVALKVPPERLEQVGEMVSRYDGVTHNYEREDEYNLWFTVTQETRSELDRVINEIETRAEPDDMLRLPASCKFKVRVILPFGE